MVKKKPTSQSFSSLHTDSRGAASPFDAFARVLGQIWLNAWHSAVTGIPQTSANNLAAVQLPVERTQSTTQHVSDEDATPMISFSSEKLQAVQQEYARGWVNLWARWGLPTDAIADRRFAHSAWQHNSLAAFSAQAYLLMGRTFTGLADAVQTDAKTHKRIRYAVDQWLAAVAPSNYLALNPQAQQRALQTHGESIAQGVTNLLHDMRQGHVSMTDERQFEVGGNLANTEGAVVFENQFFQLLEYKSATAEVFAKPLLLMPPCINKYYILDLQPHNSFVRYALAQGHRTFVISWRNPDESLAYATWDDYIEHGIIRAIMVTQEIAGASAINALGFCIGGTMLAVALAVLAKRGSTPVASATFLTTFLDFSDTGILDIFIDEASIAAREKEFSQGGLMQGRDLARTFRFLRPNELVWNYVVSNYLQGETPAPFDLLYWNSDPTNLPGPFYAWYLRNTYYENNLIQPGRLTVCGESLDLSSITVPAYVYGSREDHIVPIGSAYACTQILQSAQRFVMGASGHIAGVINPPTKNKRNYWTRADGALPATYQDWLQSAQEHSGSWWPDWASWLTIHAGEKVQAPKAYGGAGHHAFMPAPGSYVKVRV